MSDSVTYYTFAWRWGDGWVNHPVLFRERTNAEHDRDQRYALGCDCSPVVAVEFVFPSPAPNGGNDGR